MDWNTATLTELQAGLRSGKFSATDLLEAHIATIEQVNPAVNGLVADRFEKARAEALDADDRFKQGGPDLVGFVRKVKFAQTRPGPTQRQCRGGVRRDGPVRSKGEGSRQESASGSGRCPEGAASGGWGSAACKRM